MKKERNLGSAVWYETKACADVVIVTAVSILAGCSSIYLLDKFLSAGWMLVLFFPTFLLVFAFCFGILFWIYFKFAPAKKGGARIENIPAT